MALAPIARQRRRAEMSLGVLVVIIAVGGYILVALANGPALPPGLYALLAWVLGLYLVAHLAIRRFAPYADATLLPLAALLNAVGFVTIARLDHQQARVQSIWVAIGIGVFVLTLAVIRDVRLFERYRYTVAMIGLGALLLPLAPSIGRTINGGRLWVAFGSLTFEPSEIAKVLLVAFFAAYLVDKRELLTEGRVSVGRHHLPSPRDLGPLLLAWGVALLVLAYEQDVGTSLLFFGVFAAMLYIATRRGWYVLGTLVLLAIGSVIAFHLFGHVRVRVETWLDPWKTREGNGFQIIQAQYAFGSGGIFGTGLGLGSPNLIPNAATDFVFAAIGEELGLIGTIGIVAAFMLLVGSAFRIAADATRPFSKLFAAGIAAILGFQAFLIVGGVTRVIPLTGITLPFVSYGGSSLVANFALIAILLRISDDTARATPSERNRAERARSESAAAEPAGSQR
jgi:cell division protein FtsW (lipid II flippase)